MVCTCYSRIYINININMTIALHNTAASPARASKKIHFLQKTFIKCIYFNLVDNYSIVNGNLDENYREGCHGLASCNIVILDNVIYNFCDKLEKAHVMRIFTFARFQDMVK